VEFSAEDERMAGILGALVGRIYENGKMHAVTPRHTTEVEHKIPDASAPLYATSPRRAGQIASGPEQDCKKLIVCGGCGGFDLNSCKLKDGPSARIDFTYRPA
jgi:hypothetical protein